MGKLIVAAATVQALLWIGAMWVLITAGVSPRMWQFYAVIGLMLMLMICVAVTSVAVVVKSMEMKA